MRNHALFKKYSKMKEILNDKSYCIIQIEDNDGQRVAVGGSLDYGIDIVNVATGIVENRLAGHTAMVSSLAWLSDGSLVSGSFDTTVIVWDVERERITRQLKGHNHNVECVLTTPDNFVISGSIDMTIRCWNIETGECDVWEGHTSYVNNLSLLTDGRIASGSEDKTIRVWNKQTGLCEIVLYGDQGQHGGILRSCALPSNRMATADRDGNIRVWNISTETMESCFPSGFGSYDVQCLNENHVVAPYYQGRIAIFNIETGEKVRDFKAHKQSIHAVCVLFDGSIASVSDDGFLRIWGAASASK